MNSIYRRCALAALPLIAEAGLGAPAFAQVNIPLTLYGENPTTGVYGPLTPGKTVRSYTLGINVGIGGGMPQLYLLDTGSAGLIAAMTPAAMPTQPVTPIASNAVIVYFGTHAYIFSQVAVPSLSFYGTSGSAQPVYTLPTLSPGYQVGSDAVRIAVPGFDEGFTQGPLAYTAGGTKYYYDTSWLPALNQGIPPFSGAYFGTFGAGDMLAEADLIANGKNSGVQTSVSSVLGQATATGYAVSANAPIFAQGAPQSAATAALFNQISCSPCVTLGLSNPLKAQFASLVPWNSPGGIGPNPFPNSGANASTQHGETFQYTFSLPGQAAVTYSAATLLDSGTRNNDLASNNPALGTSPYLNTTTGNIQAGATVTLTGCTVTAIGGCVPSAGSTGFTTTDSPDINVTYQVPNPNQSDILPDNTIGIGFFLLNSVLYNLAGEVIGYSPFFVTAAPLTTTPSAPIVIDATAGPLGLAGVISGPGPVTIAGGGSAQLSNVNTYTGLTTIQPGGKLFLAGPGSIAGSAGLAANGAFDISRATPAIADGGSGCVCIADLTGSGSVYLGAQNLTITNAGSAFGNSNFSGTIADGGVSGGTGGSMTLAAGTLTLSGTNTYTGGTSVDGGATLVLASGGHVDGAVVLQSGATLANGGTVSGALTMLPGATAVNSGVVSGNVMAGGNLAGHGRIGGNLSVSGSILSTGVPGTTPVGGAITFVPGSTYQVGIGASGASDVLAAGGRATLTGASVIVTGVSGFAGQFGSYAILTAAGGLDGQFGQVAAVMTPFPFLGASLAYTDDTAAVVIGHAGGISFASVGQTGNQAAAGGALDQLPSSSPLLQSAALLSLASAPAVLTALSGDIYPSSESVIQQQSGVIRSVLGGRLRQALAADGATQVAALGPVALPVTGGSPLTVWQQGLGVWNNIGSAGNAAGINSSSGGYLIGVDAPVGGSWQIGLASGFDQIGFNSTGAAASGAMTGAHLAGYAGRKFGALGIEFGAANTWYNGTINRNVAFPGFADTDKGGFGATATQIVTEATWDQVIAGAALLQPFGGLAYVHVGDSPLAETGGAAALQVGASSIDDTYASLGLRAAAPVKIGDLGLTVNGLTGWQHAFGVLAPQTSVALAGAPPFPVQGVPIARDVALVGAGLRYDRSAALSFAIGYSGWIAGRAQQNQVNGALTVKF